MNNNNNNNYSNNNNKTAKYRKISKKSYRSERSDFNHKSRRDKHIEVQAIKSELMNFPKSNWGRKWVKAILEYGRPYRMRRGIRYAQEDRISNLTVSSGEIFASVQGTAPTPYRVVIKIRPIPESGWKKILIDMAKKAIYTIKLIENSMPEDLEKIFYENGFYLYPPPGNKLLAECSCPDSQKNKSLCKHIAATVLHVAQVVDFNPFILLKLRGKEKEKILRELQLVRSNKNKYKNKIKNLKEISDKIERKTETAENSFDLPFIPVKSLSSASFKTISNIEPISFNFKNTSFEMDNLESVKDIPNLDNVDFFKQGLSGIYFSVINFIKKKYI